MRNNSKIAILFFSRSAEAEVEHKNWLGFTPKKQRQQIAQYLYRRTLKTTRQQGLDLLTFDEKRQKGQNFGERIAGAFEEVFSLGYEGVICVGNDCPNMDRLDWTYIAKSLQEGRCVIGPNFRGGAYLIGLTKSDFDREKFTKLTWQSSNLLTELRDYCPIVNFLETLRDVNGLADLKKILRTSFRCSVLSRTISKLLGIGCKTKFALYLDVQDHFSYSSSPLRAPPSLVC